MHHMFCDQLYFFPLCTVKKLPGEDYFLQTSSPPVCHFCIKNRYKHALVFTEHAIYIYWGQWIALELNPSGLILKCLAGLHDAGICVQPWKNFCDASKQ